MTVLRQPKRQGVDSHPSAAFPVTARRVVAGALQVDQARREVADGVAADDHQLTRSLPDRGVERGDDLGSAPGPVGEDPTAPGGAGVQPGDHRRSEPAEDVEAGEVVLDQLETPVGEASEVGANDVQHLIGGRVQDVGPSQLVDRRTGQVVVAGEQRAEPQAGSGPGLPDPRRRLAHRVEQTGSPGLPRPAVGRATGVPPVVDHAERPDRVPVGQLDDGTGIAQHGRFVEPLAVRVVPVVRSDHRSDVTAGWETARHRRHRLVHGAPRSAGVGESAQPGREQRTTGQQRGSGPVTQIEPEADTVLVDGPAAQRAGGDVDPGAGGDAAALIMTEPVPRQHPLGLTMSPLQVAVGPFPRVAHDQHRRGQLHVPAQRDDRHLVGGDLDLGRLRPWRREVDPDRADGPGRPVVTSRRQLLGRGPDQHAGRCRQVGQGQRVISGRGHGNRCCHTGLGPRR